MKNNIHAGHRDRLRNEFLSNQDPTRMPEHKLLEMLLFYGIPQKDTNPIAHDLLTRFGSFSAVFEADVAELAAVKGMTKNAAALIKLMIPLAKLYINGKYEKPDCFTNMSDIGEFIFMKYLAATNEKLCLLCLDSLGSMLSFDVISEGTLDSVGAGIRSIIERALQLRAHSIVISHNHPGGIAVPSREDVEVTLALKEAANLLSIKLCDHIIVAGNDYISMAESSEYKEIFDR